MISPYKDAIIQLNKRIDQLEKEIVRIREVSLPHPDEKDYQEIRFERRRWCDKITAKINQNIAAKTLLESAQNLIFREEN